MNELLLIPRIIFLHGISCTWAFMASALILFTVLYALRAYATRDKFPPGPRPHPIVGHTFQVPTVKTWRYFEDLGRKYGPIIRLHLGGDEIVVLNDPKDAEALLNQRSNNYSSRKPLVYAGKYQSQNKRMVLLPYGEELRKQRAAFHRMLQPRVVGSYEHIQEIESTRLLMDTLTFPNELEMNMKRFSASVVFTLAYGKRLDNDNKDLYAVLDILDGFIRDCYPGAHLVDAFPILDLLPDVLAPWRAIARQKHEREVELYGRLLLEVKNKVRDKLELPDCFASRLWEEKDGLKMDLKTMSYVAGSAFEAGTDTTAGTMMWFAMAMVLYPQTLKRAQAEIDELLGREGSAMPTFIHMEHLPYCFALVKEVLRWMPAAPGGFPHYTDHDDEYKGYKIKAKTMVIPNIWAMQRNEEEFPNADEFLPERFFTQELDLTQTSLTDSHYGFGFGRRSCPGKYLAAKTVWIGMVRLLWGFDFTHEVDSQHRPIMVSPENCTSGITSKPEGLAVRIAPRSMRHAETIRREWVKIVKHLA